MEHISGADLRPFTDHAAREHYAIRVRGRLDARSSARFEGMTIIDAGNETVIEGPVADQAKLYVLLARLRNLNLPLIALERV